MSYLHEWHMQQHNFLGPPPPGALGRGQRSNIIKSQILSQFQIFLNQTLCVFSEMIATGFSLGSLDHAQGFGTWGCCGVKNLIF